MRTARQQLARLPAGLWALLLAGCTVAAPVSEQVPVGRPALSPTTSATSTATASARAPAGQTEAPTPTANRSVACPAAAQGGAQSPQDAPWNKVALTREDWDDPESYPAVQAGSFWAPDAPEQRAAQAFGVLPPERRPFVKRLPTYTYTLSTPLLEFPAALPVYLLGRYPETYSAVFNETVGDVAGWLFTPALSLIDYVSIQPLGEPTQTTTEAQAAERAMALIRPFVMPDSLPPRVRRLGDGGWQIIFPQHIDNVPVLIDRPLQVILNREGQAVSVVGRRRPLLAQSLYPLRPASEAWQLLRQGCGFGITAGHLPDIPRTQEAFIVQTVSLVYLVTHSNAPREMMQPYYLFRNELEQGVFIPAVADPHVEWP